MASYTVDQKVFVVKTFFSSCGSCVAMETQYREEFSVYVAPSRDRIIKHFEGTESVCVKREKGVSVEHLFVPMNFTVRQ
jgi:hypothetical protein